MKTSEVSLGSLLLVGVVVACAVEGFLLLVFLSSWSLDSRGRGGQDVVEGESSTVEMKLVAKFGDKYSAKLVTTLFDADRDHDGYLNVLFRSVDEAVASACSEATSDDARKRCETSLRGNILKGVGDCDDDDTSVH